MVERLDRRRELTSDFVSYYILRGHEDFLLCVFMPAVCSGSLMSVFLFEVGLAENLDVVIGWTNGGLYFMVR